MADVRLFRAQAPVEHDDDDDRHYKRNLDFERVEQTCVPLGVVFGQGRWFVLREGEACGPGPKRAVIRGLLRE